MWNSKCEALVSAEAPTSPGLPPAQSKNFLGPFGTQPRTCNPGSGFQTVDSAQPAPGTLQKSHSPCTALVAISFFSGSLAPDVARTVTSSSQAMALSPTRPLALPLSRTPSRPCPRPRPPIPDPCPQHRPPLPATPAPAPAPLGSRPRLARARPPPRPAPQRPRGSVP